MSKEQKTREQLQLELKEAQSKAAALEIELAALEAEGVVGTFWLEDLENYYYDHHYARLHRVVELSTRQRAESSYQERFPFVETIYVEIAHYKNKYAEFIDNAEEGGFYWDNIPENIKRVDRDELERILRLLQRVMEEKLETKMILSIQEELAKGS